MSIQGLKGLKEALEWINILRHFMTRRNNRGDRGNLCLRPVEVLKKWELEPLARIEKKKR